MFLTSQVIAVPKMISSTTGAMNARPRLRGSRRSWIHSLRATAMNRMRSSRGRLVACARSPGRDTPETSVPGALETDSAIDRSARLLDRGDEHVLQARLDAAEAPHLDGRIRQPPRHGLLRAGHVRQRHVHGA